MITHIRLCLLALISFTIVAGAEEPLWSVTLGESPTEGPGAASSELPIIVRNDITIDGNLSDWGDKGGIDLSSDEDRRHLQDWRGEGDCSARAWLAYTPQALLLAVRVRDDKHHPGAGDLLWQGDSIQFVTATNIRGPEIGVAAGPEGTRLFCWNGGDALDGVKAATSRNGDVTVYEIAVPWAAVAGKRFPDGLFGFNVLVNDNDGEGRRGFLELTPGIGSTKEFARMALIALAGTGPAAPQLAFTPSARQLVGREGVITWNAWVYMPPSLQPAPVRISLAGPDGKERSSVVSSGLAMPGRLQPVLVTWRPPATETVGACQVTVEILGARITRPTEVATAADFAATASELSAARQSLIAANNALPRPDLYARAAGALATRVLELGPQKVAAGNPSSAFDDYRFALHICATLEAQVKAIAAGTRPERVVPVPSLDQLRIAKGNFWSGDQPVMLIGTMGWDELKRDLDLVRDLGFNSVTIDVSGVNLDMITGPDTFDLSRIERLRQDTALCTAKGFTWSYCPNLTYFPVWALRANPDVTGGERIENLPDWSGRTVVPKTKDYGTFFPFSIASSTVHDLVSRLFAVVMPAISTLTGSGVVWLMNEPAYFRDRDPGTRERFQASLRKQHGSIATLNARWKTTFADFTEIGLQVQGKDPGRYDYLRFHIQEVGDWFSWLGTEARKGHPQIWLSNKPQSNVLFMPEQGIDFEREALDWDVPGCDGGRSPHDAYLAFNACDPALLFDFQKSVAPDKPLADHEYHWVHEPGMTAEYSYATFWHSYLHGLRWSQYWVWMTGDLRPDAPEDQGSGSRNTAPSQPQVLWGAANAALDLRRLSRYVAAFPGQAQVAITFSRPSLFREGNIHRDRVIATWRAAVDLDAPVGFATDRMISQGLLKPYRLLIVAGDRFAEPDVVVGVQKFLDAGGVVARIGASYAQDPYGQPLPALTPGKGKILVINEADPATMATQLDEAFSVAGVDRPVRVRAVDGKPAWPIECRTVTVDGHRVVALIGMALTTRKIRLEGTQPITGWEDLISGERGTAAEMTLAPRDVRLLRLTP